MTKTPESVLADFFQDAFDNHELLRFLGTVPDGKRVVHSLSAEWARARLAFEAVETLQRRGMIDADLFQRLVAAVPRRAKEVVAIAASFGVIMQSAETGTPPKPSPDGPLFTWLHLSDIHFGQGDRYQGWDQDLVVNKLRADVSRYAERGAPKPDVVLVTGDIAFSGGGRPPGAGRDPEYTEARAWLERVADAVSVARSAVYVVPGNHDVDRGVDGDRDTWRLVDNLRERSAPGRTLDDSLAHAGDRDRLRARQQNYLEFASAFAPESKDLYWSAQLPGRVPVRLVGLNTALLARDNEDQRRLRLGKGQLVGARDAKESGELVITLSHHPLAGGWLADERDARGWIRSLAHIHLSGHVHDAETEVSRSGGGGELLQIAAGAVYGDGGLEGHGYSIGALYAKDGGGHEVRVWPRMWSPKNKDFRLDVEGVPDGKAFATHPITLRR